jgi:hypothetical protein
MYTTLGSFLFALSIGTISWGSTQIYANYCVPSGFQGWLTSFITSNSSPCQGLLALITNSNTLYGTMSAALFVGVFSGIRDGIERFTAPHKCETKKN